MDYELTSMIDVTAMILCNMRTDCRSPSPVLSLSSSQGAQDAYSYAECGCTLCLRGAPVILSKCHTWAWIMRVVFYSLKERYPEKKFFSLKNDVYEYMMNHWGVLGLDKKPSANWHKQIQDMLSHSRNIFESGMNHFKQNGFWRLKDLEDPWVSRADTPRSSPTLLDDSPKRRSSKLMYDGEPEDNGDASLISPTKKRCVSPPSAQLSALSLAPPSPEPTTPPNGKLDKEVAILREQLAHMTESVTSLSQDVLAGEFQTPSPTSFHAPTPVYHHNRVWEEAYSTFTSVVA